MIKFITKRRDFHLVSETEQLVIQDDITIEELQFLIDLPIIGLDKETNDLDPYVGSVLLLIMGTKEIQYVFDTVTYDVGPILHKFDDKKVYLMQNGKFDYKFAVVKYAKKFKKIYDCMVAEQRLVQGTDLSCSLQAIQQRRLNIYNSKDVRSEFIGVDPQKFKFSNKHIVYGAGDIENLFDIRDLQKAKIKERKMEFLIYDIEFPLIQILADAELEGEDLNIVKWRENIEVNKVKRAASEIKLDQQFRELREVLCSPDEKIHIRNGKWDANRNVNLAGKQDNLFGDMFSAIETIPVLKGKKKVVKKNEKNINYSSYDVLLTIFGRFKQPAPTIDDKKQSGPYVVPSFKLKQLKKGIKWVIDKKAVFPYKFTTGKGSIESYVIENPDSPMKDFVEELIKYRKYCTRINTFGESFLTKYINKVTGKVHTVYRQCFAANGRLQSGDKDNGYYNSQNVPKENEYRHCFYSGTDDLMTTDLGGAEAVIMIDKARDEKFYEMAIKNDDAHSPLGTAIWRAIGRYRINNLIHRKNHDKTPAELANVTITKKENKDMRTLFKNTTFASIYGCGYKKYGKMLNISHDEAKLGLNIMKSSIPKTFNLVESFENFALQNGYLIHNERTNSRIWYPKVLEAKANNSQMSSNDEHNVKNSARNSPISGTQADMLKEVMVCIGNEAERQDFAARFHFALLKQVHDETVYRTNDKTTLVEFKDDKEGIKMVTIPEFVKRWHIQVANRYLSYITMPAEQEVGKTWTK